MKKIFYGFRWECYANALGDGNKVTFNCPIKSHCNHNVKNSRRDQ